MYVNIMFGNSEYHILTLINISFDIHLLSEKTIIENSFFKHQKLSF